jgi:ketosteroid isomerase-like protein
LKIIPLCLLLIFVSCVSDKKKTAAYNSEDVAVIEREIADFHDAIKRAYNGASINTDSLMDNFFGKDVYYVTYWGTTEPIDSTKLRLHLVLPGIKDYDNRIESMSVKVYGEGAYAFFILRQTYTLNGVLMDEYLPTTFIFERRENHWVVVHSQRSADFQTIQQLMNVAQRRSTPVGQGK